MIDSRKDLVTALTQYHTMFPEEARFITSFIELLQHPRAYFRDHLPGHITASALIVDPEFRVTLLTHHAKLNRWLQPGGHADGDEDVTAVSLKEAIEETGLAPLRLLTPGIFDIDIHPIPERSDFPGHVHYDLRFVWIADPGLPLTLTRESHDLAWIPLRDLPEKTGRNGSILRMAEKLKTVTLS